MNVPGNAPTLLWSKPGTPVDSSFAAGGGDLFYVTRFSNSGWADSFYAIDEQSGAAQWSVKMSTNASVGDPAYVNGTVYLQSDNTSVLRGWNVQTQQQVFTTSFVDQGNTYRAPVISNNTLYIADGYYGGQCASYNVANSALNWNTNVKRVGSYGNATVAVDANQVYFTGGEGSDLIIADRKTGTILSETGPGEEQSSNTPMLTGTGGLFYISDTTGQFLDVSNPASPKVLWTIANATNNEDAAYSNGIVYVASAGKTCAIDAKTGQLDWSIPGANEFNMVVTNNVLFATQNSNTVAIDLGTHQVLWSVPVTGHLAVSDNELFIGSTTGVFAYALPEPSSLSFLIVGCAGLLNRRRAKYELSAK